MKMIKTSFGYMTYQEAKMIGDIAKEEKKKGSDSLIKRGFRKTV